MPNVTIYTDGACDLKPGRREKILTGGDPDTTNNRMELTAAVEALKSLKQSCRVELRTDSEYLQRGMTEWMENWKVSKKKRKPANWDLWEALLEAAAPHTVEWRWVQGHAYDALNRRADRLATQAIDRPGKKARAKEDGQERLF